VELLDQRSSLRVKEAEDKESPAPGHVYFAPPDYHLLLEPDQTLSLSAEEKVHFSRPSIDVLFESAAQACRSRLMGVILSGAGEDGAQGLCRISEQGGLSVVQDPAGAEHPAMPQAALHALTALAALGVGGPDHVLDLRGITRLLAALAEEAIGAALAQAAAAREKGQP
jgi:two-component system chemotaxis response regulator CheB